MKKKLLSLLLIAATLQAQVGDSAFETTKAAKDSQWQNWTFAGVAMVTVALGVYLCTINNGHPPRNNQ